MIVKLIEFASSDQIQSIGLRYEILRKPLNLQFQPNELLAENHEMHIAALLKNRVVGCMILKPDYSVVKMRQVAVANDMQGKGIGKAMVEFAEVVCVNKGFTSIHLHARTSAVPFYLALNYKIVSAEFKEVGIPHLAMSKTLG